ncbi:MAG: threonine ammonia-lyase [Epsilonproteobacteria bacterium]|nr:threonine ammonia-lyase [Campylobacterota bacterium]
MINFEDVKKAAKRVSKVAHKTPLAYAPILSKLYNQQVFLKKDNLQVTGSFKLRGAFNKIATLIESGNRGGVVAASAGNHAQGVALSSAYFGIDATIFMPESTPLNKIQGVESYGAKVVLKGANYDEAYSYAIEYSKEQNLSFVHPFADDSVIAGQGTIYLEIFKEIDDLDAIVVPVGGGGLISGIATAAKVLNPNIKVIGVAASGAPAMAQSFKEKKPISTKSVRTIADGIAVKNASEMTLKYILKYVDDIKLVCDDEIASAILFLLERQKLLVEGAGAVGVAALMHNRLDLPPNSKVCILLSGGNIDVTMLSLIIEKGLTKTYRKMKLIVTLIDKPGALESFAKLMRQVQANIVQIGYDRTSTDLEFGDAHVSVALETKGKEHQDEIRKILKKNGYSFKEVH